MKFDLQLYQLGNNSYLVDFKNVATTTGEKKQSGNNSSNNMSPISNEHGDPFGVLHGELSQNLDKLQLNENEQADLSRWQTRFGDLNNHKNDNNNNHNDNSNSSTEEMCASRGENILSVYPFLDVCSKVITDIV